MILSVILERKPRLHSIRSLLETRRRDGKDEDHTAY